MINLIIGIVLLIMLLIDYYIQKSYSNDAGLSWRWFAFIFSILNILAYIY